ncbi:cobalamin B12-binding domain-containing protein [Kitasatospora sp. NA04385]|uniref:cobalamin B12-binding domain-containing protein n=1 Tax=Kitasatospora sp. NA04385 TaxID=2742135 RepID=UPI001590629D|nr:cobalamin-dependent protein [Kitasatospora sp. NA04385]QKW17990.1 cobalamin B12-binding domain-containing protein [Kitasatospora sp. NA04385]
MNAETPTTTLRPGRPAREPAREPARTAPAPVPSVPVLTERLWEAVLGGDQARAADLAVGALEAGLHPEALLLDVIGALQARVGREWAADRITVIQEHAATAVNERVVALVTGHPAFAAAAAPPERGRVTVACVAGEWHAFPARLLAEVLVLRGWRVDYLGAQCPTPHLIAHLHRTAPDALALSASLSTRLPAAHTAVTAAQAAGVPVIAGGAAFGPDGRHARLLGADAWAPDARSAAERLARGLPLPASPHQPVDDLPHLADQEYTLVTRSSRELVGAVMAAMEREHPAVRSYTPLQREHTLDDLAHVVEHLAVALYTGDPELFTAFAGWTREILLARSVPDVLLAAALAVLREELRDLPRSVAVLTAALGTGAAA